MQDTAFIQRATEVVEALRQLPYHPSSSRVTITLAYEGNHEITVHSCGRDLVETVSSSRPDGDTHRDEYGNPKWVSWLIGDVEVTYFR